ncbi:unnamed protein product, partial [Rotaria sp. Silwood2]
MGGVASTAPNSLKHVEWMWQSNLDPWSKSEPAEWSHYSDVENLIIEEEFSKKQPRATLDNYYIDFNDNLQISKIDENKKRPIKRFVREREDQRLREERFMDLPVASTRSFGGEYGWISPFVIEVRRDLGLQPEELPSNNKSIIPMLVEKAACGIIEEAELKPEQIAAYEEMVKNPDEYRSFQAFTSCSRSREKAEQFGNTVFIMDVLFAFIADLRGLSEYPDEEEELITPGVCFRVERVEFNHKTNKYLIYLQLRQNFSADAQADIKNTKDNPKLNDAYDNRLCFDRPHLLDDDFHLRYDRDGNRQM